MHHSVYLHLRPLAEKLAKYLEELEGRLSQLPPPEGVWRPWRPRERPGPVAGADGSVNRIYAHGAWVFALGGYGFYSGHELGEVALWELDFLPTARVAREEGLELFLKFGMNIAELKALLLASERLEGGLVLVDGAIRSLFINIWRNPPKGSIQWFRPRGAWDWRVDKDELEELHARLSGWALSGWEAVAPRLRERAVAAWEVPELDQELDLALRFYVMHIEYGELVNLLMGLAEERRVVAVSKTSREADLVREMGIGDLMGDDLLYLNVRTRSPGYTEPRVLEPEEFKEEADTIIQVPVPKITYFYARLEEGRPVYRIEVPGQGVDPEEVLASLWTISVNGYPYPLMKAHSEVSLTHADMQKLLEMVGLVGGHPGRRPLE